MTTLLNKRFKKGYRKMYDWQDNYPDQKAEKNCLKNIKSVKNNRGDEAVTECLLSLFANKGW